MIYRFTILLFLSLAGASYAQTGTVKIRFTGDYPVLSTAFAKYERTNQDSAQRFQLINTVKLDLYERGYYLSEARTDRNAKGQFILSIRPGPKLHWGSVGVSLPDTFPLIFPQGLELNRSNVTKRGLQKFTTRYLKFLENNGYPFAAIYFDQYTVRNDTVAGNLKVEPGPFITIDSLVVKGYDRFSRNVLRYDLRYTPGMTYSETYLQKLNDYIQQIEYLSFQRPPAVAFSRDKTVLYLYCNEVKSNQVDGVIGLNTTEEGEVTFNGDFQLRLLNVLKRGEELQVRWRRPDQSISELDLGFTLPYLVNTPFWLQGHLNIFRQDSSFVNTTAKGFVKYLIESGTFLSAGIDYRASNVLTENYSDNPASTFNSFNTTAYTLGFERSSLNRTVVPTKGNFLRLQGSTGQRKTATTTQDQYGWTITNTQFLEFAARHVLKIGVSSQALFGENLFENEVFRIGGLKTLRGFNEQSIYASGYGIATLEYRYMIGTLDYLTVFTDMAYVENNTVNRFAVNYFYGLGGGINFQTPGGIFSLFYALGRDDQNPFDFRTSKIHFGYVNRF